MNLAEYKKVESLSYLEYCDYLQSKYGIGKANYMTNSFYYNANSSRTSEGLMVHHKYEDHVMQLSDRCFAMKCPYEWQLAENLVYCDYLEHLYLHMLICEFSTIKNPFVQLGIGGVITHIVPQLNDLYSGWAPTVKTWRKICFDRVKDEIDVYFALLKRFKQKCNKKPYYTKNCLCSGYNEEGNWPRTKNKKIFEEIKKL